jgi:hypothetical protein
MIQHVARALCCQTPTGLGGRRGSSAGRGHRLASLRMRRAARPGFSGVLPTVIFVHADGHGQINVPQ